MTYRKPRIKLAAVNDTVITDRSEEHFNPRGQVQEQGQISVQFTSASHRNCASGDYMSRLRNYSAGTRSALVTLSRGSCYYPGCGEPVVRLVEEEYYNNYEIAHIRGAQELGPRHDGTMTNAERKAFPNLILLCIVHHKRVDGTHRDKYRPETLLAWKAAREAEGHDALTGLTRLTEDTLQEILVEAYEMKHREIMETLARLEQNDSQAAALLREMLDEITRLREYSTLFDPDSASRLYAASIYLAELDLDRSARRLTSAASTLEALPQTVQALEAVVNRLGSMEGFWR